MSLFTLNNKKIILIIAGFIFVSIFYFFFLSEYIDYLAIKNNPTVKNITEYYKKHPIGFFTEDVNFLEIAISDDIDKIRQFLDKYPDSDYTDKVKQNSDNLWSLEINKYIEHIKAINETDPNAVRFFTSLLHYMKNNYTKTIHLNLKGNVNLRELTQYDKKSQTVLNKDINRDPTAPPLKPNLVPLESVYQIGHIKSLEDIILSSLTKSFENLLSANFIEVVSSHSSELADLRIDIYYNIRNEESEINMVKTPSLWEYWKYDKFVAYLMGITIDFDFSFNIPGSGESYTFKRNSDPGNFVRDIGNIKNGYVLMTRMTFQNYAQEIIKMFGLNKNSRS